MTKITHMEIASALSHDSRISIQKSFFGFSTKAVYTSTNSPILTFRKECKVDMANKLMNLIKTDNKQLDEVIKKTGTFVETEFSNHQLQALISKDHQFVAIRLYKYSQLSYEPVTEVKVFENKQAELVCKIF